MSEKEYIERGEAIAKTLEQLPVNELMDNVESALMNIHAADVRPVVRGEWIDERWRNNPFGSTVPYSCDATCSACGIHSDVRIRRGKKEWGINSPYCPACGADMKEHEG